MDIVERFYFILLPVLIAAFFASIIPRKQKEKEIFNGAADSLYTKLAKERRCVAVGRSIDKIEFESFGLLLPCRKRKSYAICVSEYYNAKIERIHNEAKGLFHKDTVPIQEAIDNLIKFTKVK